MREAMRESGATTAAVEAGLRFLVQAFSQSAIRRLQRKVRWEGNLNQSRSVWPNLAYFKKPQVQPAEQGFQGELRSVRPAAGREMTKDDPVQALAGIAEIGDGPPCPTGSLMVRSGSCHRCLTCGTTSGCS